MKKLLVLALTVVMMLAIVSVVSAAEVSTWMGGDEYFYYDSQAKMFKNCPNTFTVGNITAKVTEGNTWAKTFLNIDTWQGTSINGGLKYAMGVDKIGGILSLSLATKDQDICNIGQYDLHDVFNDYKTDPNFNTYGFGNEIAAVVDTDSFAFKAETSIIDKVDGSYKPVALNAIAKFDGGKAYIGYKTEAQNDSFTDIGGEFKMNDLAIKADFWINTVSNTNLSNEFQVNVAQGQWDATVTYMKFADVDAAFAIGANYKVTEKALVGAKYFGKNYQRFVTVNEDETTTISYSTEEWEVFGQYDLGVVDIRAGLVKNTGSNESTFVLGAHAAIW